MDSLTEPELLIYIPCWKDFEMARNQAEKIRQQVSRLDLADNSLFSKIYIVASINYEFFNQDDLKNLEQSCDEVVHFPQGIGADVNISLGFLKAIELRAKRLWILSTNDLLTNTALETLAMQMQSDSDLIVMNRSGRREPIHIKSTFGRDLKDLPFGLISSVIYTSEAIRKFFPTAPKLNWTGWGQLAVIESAAISMNGLRINNIPQQDIFDTTSDQAKSVEKSSVQIQRDYRHSFFGLPLLINAIYIDLPGKRKQLLNQWNKSSWYKIYFYDSKKNKLENKSDETNPMWIQDLCENLLKKNSLSTGCLLMLGKAFNWSRFKDNSMALRMKKFLN